MDTKEYHENLGKLQAYKSMPDIPLDPMSMEKPCCCKCWHYYTNEGIAKKMIKDGTFSAKQIADYWDVSDICGA